MSFVASCELADVFGLCLVRSPTYGLGISGVEDPGDTVNVTVLVGTAIPALVKCNDNHIASYCDHLCPVCEHGCLSDAPCGTSGADFVKIGTHVELEGIRTVMTSILKW